jgi:S1-C subfamily serine protease
VERDGPADKAGLRGTLRNAFGQPVGWGDVIVGYNDQPVDTEVELADLLAFHPQGQPVVLDILRGGRAMKITITPGSRTAPKDVI